MSKIAVSSNVAETLIIMVYILLDEWFSFEQPEPRLGKVRWVRGIPLLTSVRVKLVRQAHPSIEGTVSWADDNKQLTRTINWLGNLPHCDAVNVRFEKCS